MEHFGIVSSVQWTRKVWHITGGLIAITICIVLGWPWTFAVAAVLLLTWVTIESLRRREPWFGKLFYTISAPFVRGRERRTIVGNTWFALIVTILSFLLRDPYLLAASIVGWTFGDPAAEIFGKLIRSPKFFDAEKSLAGVLGCFVTSFAAYYGFFWVLGTGGAVLSAALTGAIATTLAEMFSLSFTINDNFTIPLVSALALSFVLR